MGDFCSYSALLVVIISTSIWSSFCDDFFFDIDDGICQQNVSEPKMLIKYKRVPYRTTYLSRCWPDLNCIKTKLNTRLESYYQIRNEKSEIQVCCEGYEKDEEKSKRLEGSGVAEGKLVCKPKCAALCINSYCSHPNTCTCLTGFAKDHGVPNVCIPSCDITCINGYCEEPNECSCKPGYEIKDNPGICEPICDGPCLNGTCIFPDVCECLPGFSLDGYRSHLCNPVCESGCASGICVAPGVCQCLPGYKFVGESRRYCVNSSSILISHLETTKMYDLRNWTDILSTSTERSEVKDNIEESAYTCSTEANVSMNNNNEKCICTTKECKSHPTSTASYWLGFGECIGLLFGFTCIITFVLTRLNWRNALARLHLLNIGHLCFRNPLYYYGEEKSVVKV